MTAHDQHPTGATRPADVGILFVHGIGAQKRGSYLDAGVDCILQATPYVTEIASTQPKDREMPWTRTIDIAAADQDPDIRILAADGWWDDVVAEASDEHWRSLLRLWGWTVLLLPSAVQANMLLAMLQSSSNSSGQTHISIKSRLVILQGVAWRCILFTPIMLIVIGFGTGLALIDPIIAHRNKESKWRMQKYARLVVGDAWAFAVSPERRSRILERIEQATLWLRSNSKATFIVAHSQGGGISRSILGTRLRGDALTTMGSGAQQLRMIGYSSKQPVNIILGWLSLIIAPISFALIGLAVYNLFCILPEYLQAVHLFGIDAIFAYIPYFLRVLSPLLVLLLLVAAARFGIPRRNVEGEVPPVPQVASWTEVISRYDPVCTGGELMVDGQVRRPNLLHVVNFTRLLEIFAEHTRYLLNPCVSKHIASTIADLAQRQPIVNADVSTIPRSHRVLNSFWIWGLPITLGLAGVLVYVELSWAYQFVAWIYER